MRFFTVFDLLVSQTKRKGISIDEMYAYFRQQKIKKAQIEELQNSAYIPGDLKDCILSFLYMTELEAALVLGRIPGEYQNSFFEKHISYCIFTFPGGKRRCLKD